jgi:hypothetical protein
MQAACFEEAKGESLFDASETVLKPLLVKRYVTQDIQ